MTKSKGMNVFKTSDTLTSRKGVLTKHSLCVIFITRVSMALPILARGGETELGRDNKKGLAGLRIPPISWEAVLDRIRPFLCLDRQTHRGG